MVLSLSLLITLGILTMPELIHSSGNVTRRTQRYGAFLFDYPPREERLVRYLGRLSGVIEERVEEDLGLSLVGPIRVTIASTHADFVSFQAGHKRVREWAAAVAYPSQGRILIKAPGLLVGGHPHFERIFFHEVAHVALDQALRKSAQHGSRKGIIPGGPSPPGRIPRWLHEGYALYVAREWSPSREVLLTRAVLSKRVIPLGRLVTEFPEEEEAARLAYAQSADLVHFLIRSYGKENFRRFLAAIGQGFRFGRACREAFGEGFHLVEEKWLRHLKRRYTWVPILASTGTLWFITSVVFLAAYARKTIRSRAKLARWAEQEGDDPRA